MLPAGPALYVRGSRYGIVSAPADSIGRAHFTPRATAIELATDDFSVRNKKLRLPADVSCSQLGSVSDGHDQQALAGLSWLSFSRPRDLPGVPEIDLNSGRTRHRVASSPRWRRLNEPDGPFTRIWPHSAASARTPSTGFVSRRSDKSNFQRTRFNCCGPVRTCRSIGKPERGLSPSPRLARIRHRIELQDYAEK